MRFARPFDSRARFLVRTSVNKLFFFDNMNGYPYEDAENGPLPRLGIHSEGTFVLGSVGDIRGIVNYLTPYMCLYTTRLKYPRPMSPLSP